LPENRQLLRETRMRLTLARDLLNRAGFFDRHRYPMAVDYQGAGRAPAPESSRP